MAQTARILRARCDFEECLQSIRYEVRGVRRSAVPRRVQTSRPTDESEDGGDAGHLANRKSIW